MTAPFKMPPVRDSVTAKLAVGGLKVYATVGLREDGTPGEIFLKAAGQGSLERGLLHSLALMVSVALQNGVPLEKIVEKLAAISFEPSGRTNLSAIPMANSIVDLISKWLKNKFLKDSV